MTIGINEKALGQFANIDNIKKDNAIITKGEGENLKSTKNFHSRMFRWMRGKSTRKANNEVRTMLLKDLGEAFGIKAGIGTDGQGRATFSKDYMNKLKSLLGPEFRAEDFGINETTGLVSSGKPLTKRRITAIMNRAALFKELSFKDFNEKVYQAKYDEMMADFKSPQTQEILKKMGLHSGDIDEIVNGLKSVGECIKFLGDGIKDFVKETEDYKVGKELNDLDEDIPRYEMYNPNTKEYEKLKDTYSIGVEIGKRTKGIILHLENTGFSPYGCRVKLYEEKSIDEAKSILDKVEKGKIKVQGQIIANQSNGADGAENKAASGAAGNNTGANIKDAITTGVITQAYLDDLKKMVDHEDIGKLQSYVEGVVKNFTKYMIDTYMMCKQRDKLETFFNLLAKPGVCMEARLDKLQSFIQTNLQNDSDVKKTAKEIDFEKRTAPDANLGVAVTAYIERAIDNNPDATWEDMRGEIIAEFKGKKRTLVESTNQGFTPLMKDGKEVNRELTEKDIDELGSKIYNDILGV